MCTIPQIESAFVQYALAQENIRAAVVVGSRARSDHPADAWSDLDIILFCRSSETYQNTTSWIEALAPVWLVIPGRTVTGDPERLVLFAGGAQVDFVFNPAEALHGLQGMIERGELPDIVRRGVRVLFDKDGQIPPLPAPSPLPAQAQPGADEFQRAVENFWFTAVYTARQLCRGDLVFFKGCEAGLKGHLLPMLEWHARAQYGWGHDTWHKGRYSPEWADPRAVAALAKTYARLDPTESWQAFLELLDLFRWLTGEVAARLGIELTVPVDEIHAYILTLRAENAAAPASQAEARL